MGETLGRIATRQHGLVTRRQALAAGVGEGAIRDRLRRGALHRVHRGIYLVGHPVAPALAREHAALLAVGPGAVLARRTAAALWGLPLPVVAEEADLLLVGRQVRPRPGLAVRRAIAPLPPADLRRVDGLPVTAPARTIVDLAAVLDDADLERMVHEAQVLRLASPAAVRAALERAGAVPGAGSLRQVLDGAAMGVTRSDLERALTRLLRGARLPPPRRNARLGRFEVDALWPAERLIVEVDGFAAHGTRRAFEHDRRRDMELQAAGFRVVRVTWRQLEDEPLAVAARLAVLLSATSLDDESRRAS